MSLCPCILLALIAVICQAATTDERETLTRWNRECMEETGLTPELISKSYWRESVDASKFKRHAFCLLKKIGYVDETGQPVVQVVREDIKKIFDQEEVEAKIKKCVVKRETPEETSFQLLKCLYANL